MAAWEPYLCRERDVHRRELALPSALWLSGAGGSGAEGRGKPAQSQSQLAACSGGACTLKLKKEILQRRAA